jgi:hypothetical protein
MLDFQKVGLQEKLSAKEMFAGDQGSKHYEQIQEKLEAEGISEQETLNRERALKLKERIENATDEEILEIEAELNAGKYADILPT